MLSKHLNILIICSCLITGLLGFGLGVAVQQSRSAKQYTALEATQPSISADIIDQQIVQPTTDTEVQAQVEADPVIRTSFTGSISAITNNSITIERPGDNSLPKTRLTFALSTTTPIVDATVSEVQPGLTSVQEVDITRDILQKGDIITAYSATDIFADQTPGLTKLQRFAEYSDISQLTN